MLRHRRRRIALHGANLWPQAAELQGLDGFTAGMAQGRRPRQSSWPAGRICWLDSATTRGRSSSGQTHEYGTTLLVLAGLFNLLAISSALELRKEPR